MSVIFGLFYKDGRPLSGELGRMYSGMQHFPHEKYAFLEKGNCGFGNLLTYNTPEAVGESMPRWIEEGHLLFVSEGRIDNRDELFVELGILPDERAEMPDGDLMLKAYRQWGEECVNKLMGKWSLAAFHTDTQKLFVARDKWDYTAIDYYDDEKVIAFSSSSKGLFPLPFIEKKIDELMLARLIVVWPGDYDKTYFENVRRLLPSCSLSATRESLELRRYWNYTDVKVRKGLKLEDYTEDLFDKLNQAVVARLRSYRPVAATLSGGMDSSTVCVLAAEHLAKEGIRLKTYSHVPFFAPSGTLSPNSFGDERPFIEAVVAASGNMDPVFLDSAGISPIEGMREMIRLYGEPFHGAGNAFWLVDIYTAAAREGFGTLLLGEYGNATTSWKGVEDALPAGEIVKRYGVVGLLKKKMLKPLLYGDNPFGRIYKCAAFGRRPWRKISYCAEEFEASLNLEESMRRSGFDPSYTRYYKNPKNQVTQIFDYNVLRLPYGAYIGCETGLELRDPTGDVRVIESALAIPNDMFLGEMNKWVLRTMMKGRLPDKVRLNTKKGKQSSDLPERLWAHREEMDHILAEMESHGFGQIADIKRLRREWGNLKANYHTYPRDNAFHLLRPIAAYIMCETNSASPAHP